MNVGDEGRYVEFISRSLNGSAMSVGVDWLEPGEIHVLHRHAEAEEWYHVVRGTAKIWVGDVEQVCGPGTGVFIPADAAHRVENISDETCEFLYEARTLGRRGPDQAPGTVPALVTGPLRRPAEPTRRTGAPWPQPSPSGSTRRLSIPLS